METPEAADAALPMPAAVSRTQALGPMTTLQHANTTDTQPIAESNDLQFSLDIPWDHLWDDIAEPWGLLNHC